MSDREKLHEWIDRFNDNDLSGEELERFLEMLKTDPRLRAEVRLDKELNSILAEEDEIEFRRKILDVMKKRSPGQQRNWLLMAAMFLVLAGMVALFFWAVRKPLRQDEKNQPFTSTDTINRTVRPVPAFPRKDNMRPGSHTPQEKRELLADNFTPNPAFENMLGTTVREGGITMLKPDNGLTFHHRSVIRFEWKKTEGRAVRIQIVDPSGRQALNVENITHSWLEVPADSLPPGLYYYKVVVEDELVHLGKFFVR
jgi:hypothetical protein